MATFPSINPSFWFTKENDPNVRVIKLGDGYQHRVILGLPDNQNGKRFNFKFENIDEADSDTIETFLDDHGGTESFDYTPPEESTQMKFVCEVWDKTITFNNRATIQATFREVFEPWVLLQ